MMKRVVLFCLGILPFFAFAQFDKGQVYLGGTMSASIQNSGNTSQSMSASIQNSGNTSQSKSSSLSVSPIVGYFLTPKLVLGGSVGYSSSYSKSIINNTYYDANGPYTLSGYLKNETNSFTISSFVRYYIPISKSFYFAAQGQFIFSRANSTYTNFNNGTLGEQTIKSPSYTFGPSIRPVLIFFPSAKWSVEASIGAVTYNHTRSLSNTNSSNTALFSAGSLSFGLAYYFNRKSE